MNNDIVELQLSSVGNHKNALLNSKKFDTKMASILKEVAGQDSFFAETESTITNTGQRMKSFFVSRQNLNAAIEAYTEFVDKEAEALKKRMGKESVFSYDIQEFDAHLVTGYKTLHSPRAVSQAKVDVYNSGGKLEEAFTQNNRNRYKVQIPVRDEYVRSGLSERAVLEERLKNATNISRQDYNFRKHKEEIALSEAVAKDAFKAKLAADKSEEKEKKEAEKKALRDKKEAERKEAKDRKDAELDAAKRNMLLIKVIAGIAAAVRLLRRIVTTTLAAVNEQRDNALTGIALNLPAERIQHLKGFASAHGMEKDTLVNSVKEIQAAFSDPANLNDKALNSLALFVPNLEKFVMSGMGGEHPLELLKVIEDSAMKLVEQGKNKYGEYVGKDEARRLMIQELSNIFPNVGTTFTYFSEAYRNSGGSINTIDEWFSTFRTNLRGLSDADFRSIESLSLATKNLAKQFEDLTTGTLAKFGKSFLPFIEWLQRFNFGKSAEEKYQKKVEDTEKLLAKLAERRALNDATNKNILSYYEGDSKGAKELRKAKIKVDDLLGDVWSLEDSEKRNTILNIAGNDPELAGLLSYSAVLWRNLHAMQKELERDYPVFVEGYKDEQIFSAVEQANKSIIKGRSTGAQRAHKNAIERVNPYIKEDLRRRIIEKESVDINNVEGEQAFIINRLNNKKSKGKIENSIEEGYKSLDKEKREAVRNDPRYNQYVYKLGFFERIKENFFNDLKAGKKDARNFLSEIFDGNFTSLLNEALTQYIKEDKDAWLINEIAQNASIREQTYAPYIAAIGKNYLASEAGQKLLSKNEILQIVGVKGENESTLNINILYKNIDTNEIKKQTIGSIPMSSDKNINITTSLIGGKN